MLGAKLLMIALDPDLRSHPGEIFSLATLQSAGIFFGGFILALVFAYFYMRAQGLPVLATSDIFAPGLAIGHGIGRLGCFAAGCCWGKPTHLPWAVTFTNTERNHRRAARHPAASRRNSTRRLRKPSSAWSWSPNCGGRIAMAR